MRMGVSQVQIHQTKMQKYIIFFIDFSNWTSSSFLVDEGWASYYVNSV